MMFPPETLNALRQLGEVRIGEPADVQDLDAFKEAMDGVQIAVTAWGFPRLDRAHLDAAPGLKFVMHAASSVHSLVSDDFWDAGIPVSQSGNAMAPAVAELSLTFTMALLRRTQRLDHALRSGVAWDDARLIPRGREIRGARIGVVGASRTGREYIRMCRALGADIRVYDPYLSPSDPLHEVSVPLAELLEESQVLALHAPSTPQSRGMLGAAEFALLQDGAMVVNTARAELLDAEALYRELASGRLDAALDVFEVEPAAERWLQLPNVLLTPHLGGATVESRRRAGTIVVEEIRRFLNGQPLNNALTVSDLARMG